MRQPRNCHNFKANRYRKVQKFQVLNYVQSDLNLSRHIHIRNNATSSKIRYKLCMYIVSINMPCLAFADRFLSYRTLSPSFFTM